MKVARVAVVAAFTLVLTGCAEPADRHGDIRERVENAGYSGTLILDDAEEAVRAVAALRDEIELHVTAAPDASCPAVTLAGVRLSTADLSSGAHQSEVEALADLAKRAGEVCQLAGAEFVTYEDAYEVLLEAKSYLEQHL